MNERIITSIEKIEAIRIAMGKEYTWKNVEDEIIPQWQYYDSNDNANEAVPKERAISDRKKMLDILEKFYDDYAYDYDGLDDFITLFGVYCNHYILFNLHKAIPDNDFGIHGLWPSIKDIKLQKYLLHIQQGIFKGIFDGYEDFLDANDLLSQQYSLPNLYLFIHTMQIRDAINDKEDKSNVEELAIHFYSNMNPNLRDYSMGVSNFIKHEESDDYPGNPNPLPYAVFRNPKEHHIFLLTKNLTDAFSDIEHFNNQSSIRLNLALKKIYEFSQGITEIINSNDDDGLPEYTPIEWRDSDAIIYRQKFLSIPLVFNWSDGPNWLFNKVLTAELEKDETIKEKDEIIKDFTHTYENMKATKLYQLAMTLLSKGNAEERQLGRTALLEYTRKESLTKDVYMLKLKFEHNTELLQEIIKKSCNEHKHNDHVILDIINQALSTCLITAFYDPNTEKARLMRRNIKKLWENINEAMLDFERNIIYNDNNCIKWLHNNGFIINIKLNDIWNGLCFSPNGYAEIFLRNILTEFFLNFIKYSDIKKNAFLEFKGDDNSLQIIMTNQLPNGKKLSSNSKIGINAIGKTLHVLWGDKRDSKAERITTNCKNNIFTTCISLPTHIFSKEVSL